MYFSLLFLVFSKSYTSKLQNIFPLHLVRTYFVLHIRQLVALCIRQLTCHAITTFPALVNVCMC